MLLVIHDVKNIDPIEAAGETLMSAEEAEKKASYVVLQEEEDGQQHHNYHLNKKVTKRYI